MQLSLQFSRIAGLGACLCGALGLLPSFAAQTPPKSRILVYTRNYTPDGKGYVHDNIAASVAAIRKMGDEAGFAVDVLDDPGVFTESNLRQYAALRLFKQQQRGFQRRCAARRLQALHRIRRRICRHSLGLGLRAGLALLLVGTGRQIRGPSSPASVHRSGHRSRLRRGQRIAPAVYMDRRVLLSRPPEPGYPPVLVTDRTKLATLEPMTIDVAKFPVDLPLAWYQNSTAAASFTWRLATTKRSMRIPFSTESSRTGFFGR